MGDTVAITIQRPGKSPHHFDLSPGIYTLGSDNDNKIVLPDPSISWRHAIFSYVGDHCYVEDLSSDTGTYLDGKRISDRVEIRPGQRVQIGYYVLEIGADKKDLLAGVGEAEDDERAMGGTDGSSGADAKRPPDEPDPSGLGVPGASGGEAETETAEVSSGSGVAAPPVPVSAPAAGGGEGEEAQLPAAFAPQPPSRDVKKKLSPEKQMRLQIKKQIHTELLDRLDLKRMTATHVGEDELRTRTETVLEEIIDDVKARLPKGIDPQDLQREIFNEAVALGPLEDLLDDPSITEIMVNGHAQVYIEQAGKLLPTGMSFVDDDSVEAIIERIVAPIGRRIDESQPYVDARLPDGSRVNAIIPPLALDGPTITIRKFSKEPFRVSDLVDFGTLTWNIAAFIDACVKVRKNIVVSGGTGSGKTTVLNVLSSYLPDTERIITIEDAAELRLTQEHVVRLESRPPNIEGKGAITIRDLVRNALRMRPDRIVVGECRGPEALDMLQAMNTGHEGSLTTVHANSPRDAIARLETMVLMGGMELPLNAIREQIGSAIQMFIQLSRFSDGTRKVSRITEVCGMEGEKITMQDLFEFRQTGVDDDGKVLGRILPTGSVPTFIEEFKHRGLSIDQSMFDPHI